MNHAVVVEAARAVPGTWVQAAAYASLASAESAARRVPLAERIPAYEPAGSFEAYAASTGSGPFLWVRSTEGGPYPALPARMSVRIPAMTGAAPGEVGVLTVSVRPFCQVCGGPRGWDVVGPVEMHVRNVLVTVDRWSNPCGHDDVYADVLEESRRTPAAVDPAISRGRGHRPGDPARAGVFRPAVELVLQAAAEHRAMHAKQAAALLRINGHVEAAGLVEVKIRAERGHLSAKAAAHFLTVEGAARRSTSTTRQESNA
ncbi:hypothetical protein [Streptomyces sp. CCM_MD2014]|uniref:hypothetical protein n=1 Tax=Streptomyces sp. CCM_MD2014 TaxID=1561022 RepID=UPI00052ACFC2|nr:hypothetical protein [Streptomyces sp. CCM_MD2014]AIV35549.1 hypothetical protein NI25_20265 [Streptomyces sp. CCM_MD2014]